MKQLELPDGKFAIVDDEDYPVLNRFTWHFIKNDRPTFPYACYKAPYSNKKTSTTYNIPITSFLTEINYGNQVISINGNYLDCRKENLKQVRIYTKKQNAKKIKIFKGKPTTSKYKGVSLQKGKWRAYINPKVRNGIDIGHNHQIGLGSYRTQIEAALAYNRKALELYGENAYQNKIEDETNTTQTTQ